jgi:predicted DNA-binding protein with PD1-like motif
MESRALESGWLVRFAHGDDVVGGLVEFARAQGIRGAWVNLLGAIEDPELGYYELASKSYTRRVFPGDWEIMGAVGNLGRLGETPVLHVHITISGPDFAAKGGHLFAGRAGATCEVFVRDLKTDLERVRDESIGLALWALEPK